MVEVSTDDQSGVQRVEEVTHPVAAPAQQSVPDQSDLVTVQVATPLTNGLDHAQVVHGTKLDAKRHPNPRAIADGGHDREHPYAYSDARGENDQGQSARCPGLLHRWCQRDARPVLDDEPAGPRYYYYLGATDVHVLVDALQRPSGRTRVTSPSSLRPLVVVATSPTTVSVLLSAFMNLSSEVRAQL